MLKSKSSFFFGLICGVVILSVVLIFQQYKVSRLEFGKMLDESEKCLLKDEIRALRYQALAAKTYEEGYNDAIIRSGGGGNYTDGYHAAIIQFAYEGHDTSGQEKEPDSK